MILRGVVLITCILGLASPYKVGVVVKSGSENLRRGYEQVIHEYNEGENCKISSSFAQLEDGDLFSISQKLCDVLALNVTTIVVSNSVHSTPVLRSLFNGTNVPYITTTYQEACSRQSRGYSADKKYDHYLGVSLMPDYIPAVASVIRHYNWSSMIYIYDSDSGPSKLQRILGDDKNTVEIRYTKRISNFTQANDFLRSIEKSDRESVKYVVLDCKFEMVKEIIANHVNDLFMGRRNFHFLLTHPVINELTGSGLPGFAAVNITALRMESENEYPSEIKTIEEALIMDAASVITEGYKLLEGDIVQRYRYICGENLNNVNETVRSSIEEKSCAAQGVIPYELGESISKKLRQVKAEGRTGDLRFESEVGCRLNYGFKIVRLSASEQLEVIGEWDDISLEFKPIGRPAPGAPEIKDLDKGRAYTVAAVVDEPYLIRKEPDPEADARESYDGYFKELLDLISGELEIRFEIIPIRKNKTELVMKVDRKETDISIGLYPLRKEDLQKVESTQPFMSSSISAMIKKTPEPLGRGLYTFLSPFSLVLWIFVASTFAVVIIVMFLVSFFTTKKTKCEDGKETTAGCAIFKSICYSLEAFTPHYLDSYYARSISGRIIGNVWWLFIIFVFSSYTANLVPFLSSFRPLHNIKTTDDLARQNDIGYGLVHHSNERSFFKDSKYPVINQLNEIMNKNSREWLVNTVDEGIQRVRDSNGMYAFFMESSKLDYINSRSPCNTAKLPITIGKYNFGLIISKGSYLRGHLDRAILKLGESGALKKLKTKWWVEKSDCNIPQRLHEDVEMPLENFIGVFFILAAGVGLGLIVGFIEVTYKACTRNPKSKVNRDETASLASLPEKESDEPRYIISNQ